MDPEMVKRICQTYAVDSLRTFADSSPGQPFRYLYVSGMLAVRDQTQKPAFAPEYSLMRVRLPLPFPEFSRLTTMLTISNRATLRLWFLRRARRQRSRWELRGRG